jgi:hypothetical protein
VEDYRRVVILSEIPKLFEFLVYRTIMYVDLTVTSLLEYASFVLNSIEEKDVRWIPFTRFFRKL